MPEERHLREKEETGMNLTYITWGYAWDQAIIAAFEQIGFTVEQVATKLSENDEKLFVEELLGGRASDIVFSVNFYKEISDFCQREGVPYASWVLQLPDFDLYTAAVTNTCNYIGICDSYLVQKLWEKGVTKAFYLPDAIEAPKNSKEENKFLYREACFVAEYQKPPLHTETIPVYSRGYIDAFLHTQRVLMGEYILENGLIERVHRDVMNANPVPEGILPEFHKLFLADKYLAPACTALQQSIFLQNYEKIMTIYSNGDFSACKCEKHPFLEDTVSRNRVYAEKEFTVVLAPHTLHNGIPRQALEVIAAGGFPLCTMQKDYSYFFKEDENLACFHSMGEFNDLLVRYGNDADRREKLRQAAYELVVSQHTYQHRIQFMLEMWEKM